MSATPGPWRWFNYPDGRKLLSGSTKAVIHCPDAPMTCDPADAALIAAAPTMLAALHKAVETIHALHGDIAWAEYQHSPEMKQITAAIAATEVR